MACFSTLSTFVFAKKSINVEDSNGLIQIFNLEDASSSQNKLSLMTAAVTKAFIQYYAICGMLFGGGLKLRCEWKERVHNIVSLQSM